MEAFPSSFPCETLDPESLKWLLDNGADPNTPRSTSLDYLIGAYVRGPLKLASCIEILLHAGGKTRYNIPSVLAILRGDLKLLREQIGQTLQ